MIIQNKQKLLLFLVTGAILVGAAGIVFISVVGKRITLTARNDIVVYDRSEYSPKGRQAIALLKARSTVPVVSCVDYKSHVDFEIETNDGQRGFVGDGIFELSHGRAFGGYVDAPLTFSCP